jgi:RimJ/RimL family protein N-acetyltransferase
VPDRRPGLTRRLSRSLNRIRVRGAGEMLHLARMRASGWWSSKDDLIVFVRAAGPLAHTVEGLTFRPASPDDGTAYARDIGTDSAGTFRARLSEDVHCFVVEAEGRLLHSSWLTTSAAWTRELHAYLSPPVGDAYIYESFTRADARGRGIYPLALAGVTTWCSNRGLDRVWVAAESGNEPSRRAISKAGFEAAFVLPYRRRLGRIIRGPATGPLAAEAPNFVRPS